MMMMRIAVAALTIAMTSAIGGSQIEPMQLETLTDQSSLVVIGHVISSRTTQDTRGLLEKVATVRVVRVLRGTYSESVLRVRTRTGLVFFDRHLAAGDGGVLFLKPSARGDFEAAYPGSFALFPEGAFRAPAPPRP